MRLYHKTGFGHESLSIFVHYVPNLLSVLDHTSRFLFPEEKETTLRFSNPAEKHAGAFLLGHKNKKTARMCRFFVFVPKTGFEPACP